MSDWLCASPVRPGAALYSLEGDFGFSAPNATPPPPDVGHEVKLINFNQIPGSPLAGRIQNFFVRLILYNWATLVRHPIGEAQVIYPDIVIAGAYGRGGAQRRSPAAFAMGDNVIAGAEPHSLQHTS